MSAPRTKRQFTGTTADPSQRRITSFFSGTTSTSPSTTPAPAARGPLNAPLLPSKVQSDLLTVGMRVRKAVAEGHKTVKDTSDAPFALWSDAAAVVVTSTAAAELAPFCGINKVGGLAVQPPGSFSVPSSQESNASSASSAVEAINMRKRIFADEGDDEEDDEEEVVQTMPLHAGPWRRREEWIESEISPRSVAPAGWGNARVLAVPTTRRATRDSGKAAAAVGQENVAATADDFDDAPFLTRMEM